MGLPSNAKVKALFGVKAADQAAGDYAGGEGCAWELGNRTGSK